MTNSSRQAVALEYYLVEINKGILVAEYEDIRINATVTFNDLTKETYDIVGTLDAQDGKNIPEISSDYLYSTFLYQGGKDNTRFNDDIKNYDSNSDFIDKHKKMLSLITRHTNSNFRIVFNSLAYSLYDNIWVSVDKNGQYICDVYVVVNKRNTDRWRGYSLTFRGDVLLGRREKKDRYDNAFWFLKEIGEYDDDYLKLKVAVLEAIMYFKAREKNEKCEAEFGALEFEEDQMKPGGAFEDFLVDFDE